LDTLSDRVLVSSWDFPWEGQLALPWGSLLEILSEILSVNLLESPLVLQFRGLPTLEILWGALHHMVLVRELGNHDQSVLWSADLLAEPYQVDQTLWEMQ